MPEKTPALLEYSEQKKSGIRNSGMLRKQIP